MKVKNPTGIAGLSVAAFLAGITSPVLAQESANVDAVGDVPASGEALEEITLRDRSALAPQGDPLQIDMGTDQDGYATLDEPVELPRDALHRYFDLYRNALQNQSYAEADDLAKRVVELSIEVFGINSLDSARALTNLGIAQHHNEEYEAAQANYDAAIDIIERTTDRLNENLINPLKGLGAAQLAAGRPDQAVESFQRAVHISHVNEGPHNLGQIEVLQSLAETYFAAGEFSMVEDIQEHVFQLQARDVDLASMDIIPALENQAKWQHRLLLYEKERYTWRKIIDVIEDHYGNDDLRLIAPLTGLGQSHLFVGTTDMSFHQPTSITSGEVYLKRALRIADENPESTWQIREDAMLALGDFYIMSGKPNRARKIYEETWELLSEEPERLPNRRDHLESLVVLQRINPPKYVGIGGEVRNTLPGENYQVGKVVFDYAVNTRGFTTDIAMVEADPPGFVDMESAVQRELRAMIHRPRLENGTIVETDGLSYTHKFFYRESDLPGQSEPGDVAATGE